MSVLFTIPTTRAACGTLNWTAPELLPDMTDPEADDHEARRPDPACDVFAFSMVCYEASVRKLPLAAYRY